MQSKKAVYAIGFVILSFFLLSAGSCSSQDKEKGQQSGHSGVSDRSSPPQGDPGNNGRNGPPQGQQAGPVEGTVVSLNGTTLVIQTQSASTTLNIGDAAILSSTAATKDQLTKGQWLEVDGKADSSGSVVAKSIVIRDKNPMGSGPGAGGDQPPAPPEGGNGGPQGGNGGPQGNMPGFRGTIASVDGSVVKLTLEGPGSNGEQKSITVSDTTTLNKLVAASASDLKAGVKVSVRSHPSRDGGVSVQEVIIR